MLFSARPKETRSELFDREEELKELEACTKHPLVLITGPRRIGKTSVLKVYLKEAHAASAFVDLRSPVSSYQSLYSIFSSLLTQLSHRSFPKRLKELLQHIDGVSVAGLDISLSWGRRPSLAEVMDKLNSLGKVLIAFDEAQNLRGKLAEQFTSLVAHCYDYCDNITFILTGSEAGLLYDLLRQDDPEAPLYGRHMEEIRVKSFDRGSSIRFLERGFKEAEVDVSKEVINYAADRLDGIAGWLTEFGLASLKSRPNKGLVDAVFEKAAKSSLNEVSNYSDEYLHVVEAIGVGKVRWSQIKQHLSAKKRREVYDAELSRYLSRLKKRGYIELKEDGRYGLLDPILLNYFSLN
jgi:AAA+ ATPase superfamily predicted ATPase